MVALKNVPSAPPISLMEFQISLSLQTLIRVTSERQVHRANIIEISTETRYYVASFIDTAQAFAKRIRGYWGVENKVHYVRDVTSGRGCLTNSHRTIGSNLGNCPQLRTQFVSR